MSYLNKFGNYYEVFQTAQTHADLQPALEEISQFTTEALIVELMSRGFKVSAASGKVNQLLREKSFSQDVGEASKQNRSK